MVHGRCLRPCGVCEVVQIVIDYANYGRNPVAGRQCYVTDAPDDLHIIRMYTDFFVCLSKSSGDRVFILLFNSATRKSDLPRVFLRSADRTVKTTWLSASLLSRVTGIRTAADR